MYALVENNQITKYFQNPKGFILNDNQYSADIFTKWSQTEKEAIGIYEVITDKTNYKDPAYYNNTNSTIAFANGQVTESWGTATAKRLEDENAVDENNQPILEDGVQVINYGLKTEKETAIDNCTTVDALEALYTYTEQEDGTSTRPLGEWPEEVI